MDPDQAQWLSTGYKKCHYITCREEALTHYLLLSSADNLCKQFGPDQARQNVGPDLYPTVWHSNGITERILQKSWFVRKSADDKKIMQNYPADKESRFVSDFCWCLKVLSKISNHVFLSPGKAQLSISQKSLFLNEYMIILLSLFMVIWAYFQKTKKLRVNLEYFLIHQF